MRRLPNKSEIKTNINWEAVKKEMETAEWQDAFDGDRQEKYVFLGTVFALTPSGKYYTAFACSNVDPCPACNGHGEIINVKRRTAKKWRAARERCWRLAEKYGLAGNIEQLQKHSWYRYYRKTFAQSANWQCPLCEGLGSYEAKLDEIFNDLLEREAEEHGFYIQNGEGDPCDIFAAMSRESSDGEEEGTVADPAEV